VDGPERLCELVDMPSELVVTPFFCVLDEKPEVVPDIEVRERSLFGNLPRTNAQYQRYMLRSVHPMMSENRIATQ
jgi:hypothetical protein